MSAAHRSRKRLLIALGAAGTGIVAAYLAYRHYASNAETAEEEAGELKEEAGAKAAQEHDGKKAALAAHEFGVAPENAMELAELMSPHRGSVQTDRKLLAELAASIALSRNLADDERDGLIAKLKIAADKVVADLKAVKHASSLRLDIWGDSAKQMDEAIQAAIGSSDLDRCLVPLKTQLQFVENLLKVYAHATLSYCNAQQIQEEELALRALSEIVFKPAIKHIKCAMKDLCKRIDRDPKFYQKKVAGKGIEEKKRYESLYKSYAFEADRHEHTAHTNVKKRIESMRTAMKAAGNEKAAQPISDLLPLVIHFRAYSDRFKTLVKDVLAGGVVETTVTRETGGVKITTRVLRSKAFPGVQVKLRSGLKDIYRMIEKGILKGPGTDEESFIWEKALSLDVQVDFSKILDGLGCIFLCDNFTVMDTFMAHIEARIEDELDVDFCRIKNRWEKPTRGGWRDAMFNLSVHGLLTEIQIAHSKMYLARSEFGGHDSYGNIRCFEEMLAYTRNSETEEDSEPSEQDETHDGPAYGIIFSHAADRETMAFVRQLVEELESTTSGLKCFWQGTFDLTAEGSLPQWQDQWRTAFETANVCVCVLTKHYLSSPPCCLEWGVVAQRSDRRVIIDAESAGGILKCAPDLWKSGTGNNSIRMCLEAGILVIYKYSFTITEICVNIKHKWLKQQHEHKQNHIASPQRRRSEHHGAPTRTSSYAQAIAQTHVVELTFDGDFSSLSEALKQEVWIQVEKLARDEKLTIKVKAIRDGSVIVDCQMMSAEDAAMFVSVVNRGDFYVDALGATGTACSIPTLPTAGESGGFPPPLAHPIDKDTGTVELFHQATLRESHVDTDVPDLPAIEDPVRPLQSLSTLVESPVDILVIVDYPTHGGGGGAIEPVKYIAPFQALKDAMDAKFIGTPARIRFHTPRSIVDSDYDLLGQRIPCLCWVGFGEEASSADGSPFTSSLWDDLHGSCEFAITLMKHGAQSVAKAMVQNGSADRALWISADYSAEVALDFLANGNLEAGESAIIPDILYAALTGGAFMNKQDGEICCKPAIDLASKRDAVRADVLVGQIRKEMSQLKIGSMHSSDSNGGAGISLSRTPSNPDHVDEAFVGLPHHSSVDLNHWPKTCELLQELNGMRDGVVHAITIVGGSWIERKIVAWAAIQSYIAVKKRFDFVVFRDADSSLRADPATFDLPLDACGDVLVWMDSASHFPIKQLKDAVEQVRKKRRSMPWTFILTARDGIDNIGDEFEEDAFSEISLPEASGTTVNASSEDLIRILPPVDTATSILEVVDASQLTNLLAAALSQTATDVPTARGVKDYFDQILIGDNNSVVVRGMAPNTRFLFELRNDLIDGSLEKRLNDLLQRFVVEDGRTLASGQEWTLDKAAFASIYPQILSQMDQLSPHQREKLHECESSNRIRVTGPAGCGKTFIALHMVVDMIEAVEMSSETSLSCESPILFVGKNKALCMFFVSWINHRLRKTKKTDAAKSLVSSYLRILHTTLDAACVSELQFGSNNSVEEVAGAAVASYSLVIVDEAHHIFAAGGNAEHAASITELCTNAGKSLLLSDISQGETAAAVAFPANHKVVGLTEVVRNSSRIVTASLPFCRSGQLDDVTCSHGVRGPQLDPIMFDNCADDDATRNAKYVESIMHGLKHMEAAFSGALIHDNLVILVPNDEFKNAILPALTPAMSVRDISIVNSVDGAFAEPKRHASEPSRIVLDTLESFDGMERMFVFAVGLDSAKSTKAISGVYRAMTRAHMFVCLIQEHQPGGWLEFLGAVQRNPSAEYDEVEERRKVVKSTHLAEDGELLAQQADVDTEVPTGTEDAAGTGGGLTGHFKIESSEDDDDGGDDDSNTALEARFKRRQKKYQRAVKKQMEIHQNLFGPNLNSTGLTFKITSCVNPFPDQVVNPGWDYDQDTYGAVDASGHLTILSLAKIKNSAFEKCFALKSVTIPNGVKVVGADAFRDCKHMADLEIALSVMFIGDAAFSGCTGLKTVKAPFALKDEIEAKSIFAACKNLTSLEYIGSGNGFEFQYQLLPGPRKGGRVFKIRCASCYRYRAT